MFLQSLLCSLHLLGQALLLEAFLKAEENNDLRSRHRRDTSAVAPICVTSLLLVLNERSLPQEMPLSIIFTRFF